MRRTAPSTYHEALALNSLCESDHSDYYDVFDICEYVRLLTARRCNFVATGGVTEVKVVTR